MDAEGLAAGRWEFGTMAGVKSDGGARRPLMSQWASSELSEM